MLGEGLEKSLRADQGSTRPSRQHRAHPDAGFVQVIEAMVIGFLVISAVFFAIAFKAPPPPSSSHGTQEMQTVTWDALEALDGMHLDDPSYGNNSLSRGIALAQTGETDPLVDSVASFLPPGAKFNLYLNNGYARQALHETREPAGQTVGVSYPIEPRWQYLYGSTDLELYQEGAESKVQGHTLIPLYHENTIRDQGKLVEVSAHGNQSWVPGQAPQFIDWREKTGTDPPTTATEYHERAYTSFVQGDDTTSYPSASIYLKCDRGASDPAPCYAVDVADNRMAGYSPVEEDSLDPETGDGWARLDFTVHNEGHDPLPADTKLTIHFPVGVNVEGRLNDPGAFDEFAINGNHPDPETVTARLVDPLSPGGEVELRLKISVDDNRYAFKKIDARLSHGAVSQSQLLLRIEEKPAGSYTGGDARTVLVSGPKPAGSDCTSLDPCPQGRWGVIIPMPFGPGHMEHLRWRMDDLDRVVDSVSWADGFDPIYATDSNQDPNDADKTVREEGDLKLWNEQNGAGAGVQWLDRDRRIPAYEFLEFQFEIETNGNLTEASPRFPIPAPRAVHSGYQPPPHTTQVLPGVWWNTEPPKTSDHPGYGEGALSGMTEDREVENRLPFRNSVVEGTTPYQEAAIDITNPGSIQDAVRSAALTPDKKRVPIGETVEMDLDVHDLATFVAENYGLQNLKLETHIYAPWGVRDRIPVETFTHQAVSGSAAAPNDLLPAWLDKDGHQDLLVATTDGNVYGFEGRDGVILPGFTFPLPESDSVTNDAQPTLLTRGNDHGEQRIVVGTNDGNSAIYLLDDDVTERWNAQKPEGDEKTLAVNMSSDMGSDGTPDVFVSTNAKTFPVSNAFGYSRLVVYNGTDADGDGQSEPIHPGWDWKNLDNDPSTTTDFGFLINGTADEIGMGNTGAGARAGVYSNTGMFVGTSHLYTARSNLDNLRNDKEDDDAKAIDDLATFSYSVNGEGLVGLYADANYSWNMTGSRFVDLTNVDKIPTGEHTSMAGGGADGWVYGFNASKAIAPVSGWEIQGGARWGEISMANPLEGYAAELDGRLYGTRDGWTEYKFHRKDIAGTDSISTRTHPGVQTVDTPEGAFTSDATAISWWGGTNGLLLRSLDWLETVDEFTPTGTLHSIAGGQGSSVANLVGNLQNIDMSTVNFEGVYAVNAAEAWYVGTGPDTDGLGNAGYIVHTDDGGGHWNVTLVRCEDSLGNQLGGCGLHGIDFDGKRVWAVGSHGTVLTLDRDSMANSTELLDGSGPSSGGEFSLDLDASEQVDIRGIEVTADVPATNVEFLRSVTLDRQDLWNKTKGQNFVESQLTNYNSEYGVRDDAELDVRGYVNQFDPSHDANRTFTGDATLRFGPFRTDLSPLDPVPGDGEAPYFEDSHYSDADATAAEPPINFTVNVTFEDGSMDTYRLWLKDDGTVTVDEVEGMNWRTPRSAGFKVPKACFGAPADGCTDLWGVNVTDPRGPTGLTGGIVGSARDPGNGTNAMVFRLRPGELQWDRDWDMRVNQTYRDIAVNQYDPDRWIMVGDDARVLASYDKGLSWTDMPTPTIHQQAPGETLWTADFTHPEVGYMGGGLQTGLLWTLDGYTEFGRATTKALSPESAASITDATGGGLERLDVDPSDLIFGEESTGVAQVNIDIWDQGLDSGEGGWAPLYKSNDGWTGEVHRLPVEPGDPWPPHYNFTEPDQYPTTEVKLRFELTTPKHKGFSRFSPQVRGELTMDGYGEKEGLGAEPASPDVTVPFDIKTTSDFEQGLDSLNHSATHGWLRLKAVHNPWVLKLGNYHQGDWSHLASNTTGARVADMSLSADGETLFVGTERIYDVGETSDVPKANADGDGDTFAEDNTVYAIDVRTGEFLDTWTNEYFENPIRHIEAEDRFVYVTTNDLETSGSAPIVYRIDRQTTDPPQKIQLFGDDGIVATATVSVWGSHKDFAIGRQDPDTGSGTVVMIKSAGRWEEEWDQNPATKGRFLFPYEVPRNATFGGYIAVTEMDWDMELVGFSGSIVQTGRIHNTFTVTPPNGKVATSPTYTLEAVAWLEDWG